MAGSEDNPDWKAAEAVASALDLKHHQHLLDEGDFDRHLPNLVWHGEDLDTSVMFFQPLFKTMASSVKVGLCGQGADELHAGYPRYRDRRRTRPWCANASKRWTILLRRVAFWGVERRDMAR